jgi:hypothetical protein
MTSRRRAQPTGERVGHQLPTRPWHDRDRPARERVPLAVLVTADAGSARRGLLHLQRTAGNRAVADSLAQRPPPQLGSVPAASSLPAIGSAASTQAGLHVVGSPSPTEKPATNGIKEIKSLPLGSNAIGYTRLHYIKPPRLRTAAPRQVEGGWVAPLQPTTLEKDAHFSFYPGPGAHELRIDGERKVHGYLSEAVSSIVRDGEAEHLLDLEWARHLTYDTVVETINALAAGEPPLADSPENARKLACQQLRSALPPQLRWEEGQSPAARWDAVYTELEKVTHARDKGWHNVPDETIRSPDVESELKQRLGVPADDRLREFNHRGEIGKHPPEEIVPARFAKLSG